MDVLVSVMKVVCICFGMAFVLLFTVLVIGYFINIFVGALQDEKREKKKKLAEEPAYVQIRNKDGFAVVSAPVLLNRKECCCPRCGMKIRWDK